MAGNLCPQYWEVTRTPPSPHPSCTLERMGGRRPKGRYYPKQTKSDPEGPFKRQDRTQVYITPSKPRSGRWLRTKQISTDRVRGQALRSPGARERPREPAGGPNARGESAGLGAGTGRAQLGMGRRRRGAHLRSRGVHEVVEEPHLSWPEPAAPGGGESGRSPGGGGRPPGVSCLLSALRPGGGRGPQDAISVFCCEHTFSAKPAATRFFFFFFA